MRISDWSSDLCSSDLANVIFDRDDTMSLCEQAPRQIGADESPGTGYHDFRHQNRPARLPTAKYRLLRISGGYCSRRSEEHTSELQSLMRISYAVFCLKKKTHKSRTLIVITHNGLY